MTTLITRWWWVRHAVVTVNEGRIYGSDDLPCDTTDHESFTALAKILPKDAVLVTSQLMRTLQTSQAIADQGLGLPPPIKYKDLNEQSFGEWQGLHYEDLQAKAGRFANHDYWLCPGHLRPPKGESFIDLIARAAPVIEEVSINNPSRDIIAVSHGGTIRAALAIALGMDPERALAFTIDNLSVTRIDRIEKDNRLVYRVVMVNRPANL